ncbi:MAG: AzlD domain-containing protein [Clostridia bacterium]|nr:AzlD domain-containing protein [Clostridia bacterium]
MSPYAYILVMAAVTYLIRMLPLTLIRRQFKSQFLQSFLHYMPYVTLSVMTFPAILSETGSTISAVVGFAVMIGLSMKVKSLILVAACACLAVFLTELIPGIV